MRIGVRRFGPPSASVQAQIDAIESEEELDQLVDRLLDVETWDDLLR